MVTFGLVAELLLQVLMPILYRPRITKIEPEVGWSHRPSVSVASAVEGHAFRESYNSHGYRSPEHTLAKPAGVRRVAVLGDSFVDGSEVGDEELLTWRLQQALPGVEVINLGVYGYSTAQEAITLERTAFAFEPDLVVLLTVPNDFPGNGSNFDFFGPAPRFVLDGDSLRYESTSSPAARAAFRATNLPVPGMAFLHEHSLVYYVLNQFIYRRFIARRIQALMDAQKAALGPAERAEVYRRLVRRMKRLCDERGVGFLVAFGYERPHLRQGQPSPNAGLVRQLEADGILTADLYTALRDAELSGDSSYYYRENIHWNVRGHQLVADLLRAEIEPRLREPR